MTDHPGGDPLRDALEQIAGFLEIASYHDLPENWRNDAADFAEQARAALDSHDAAGEWLPAGEVPDTDGLYWRCMDGDAEPSPQWFSKTDGSAHVYRWSRRPIPVPEPPQEGESDDR